MGSVAPIYRGVDSAPFLAGFPESQWSESLLAVSLDVSRGLATTQAEPGSPVLAAWLAC